MTYPDRVIKQAIILRTDLNMRKGKMVAQGAHASQLAILGTEPKVGGSWHLLELDDDLVTWLNGDIRKICLGIDSEQGLLELQAKAVQAGLRCSLVQDAGHTEFGGVPTYTAVAIGPAEASQIDAITGALRLL